MEPEAGGTQSPQASNEVPSAAAPDSGAPPFARGSGRLRWARAAALRRPLVTAAVLVALGLVVLSGMLVTLQAIGSTLFSPSGSRSASLAAATSTPVPSTTPLPRAASLPAGNDWTQYRFDMSGDGANPEHTLDVSNAANLSLYLHVKGTNNGTYESTPAVVDGVIYQTAGNYLYAFDLLTGQPRWQSNSLPDHPISVSSSVAVDRDHHMAFYGDPSTYVYGVNIDTGTRVWATQLSTSKGAYIWSSPLVVNGSVYIGLASTDDNPCIRGAVYALDELTGAIAWTHYTVPEGTLGGAVWSSISANPAVHELIVTTGNPCPEGPSYGETDSILGLDWTTGATRWAYKALGYDGCDCDFGEGAVDAVYQQREYIVAGNKYGQVYALARDPSGGTPQFVWTKRISRSGFLGQGGIFEPPTYGDGLVFVGGGPPLDGSCKLGKLYAFNITDGQVAWSACTSSQLVSPAALSGGVLFVPQQDALVAYEASTGRVLTTLNQPGEHWGGVAVARGFVVDATLFDGLYWYRIPPPPTTQ